MASVLHPPELLERFPKNDFAAFHDSGLLFNTEHPDPGDPLRTFGVRRVDGGDGTDVDAPVEMEIALAGSGLDRITVGAGDHVHVRRSRP